ncbi:MAG: hypothetical protein V4649_05160 [Bacteroidota bacterium]
MPQGKYGFDSRLGHKKMRAESAGHSPLSFFPFSRRSFFSEGGSAPALFLSLFIFSFVKMNTVGDGVLSLLPDALRNIRKNGGFTSQDQLNKGLEKFKIASQEVCDKHGVSLMQSIKLVSGHEPFSFMIGSVPPA